MKPDLDGARAELRSLGLSTEDTDEILNDTYLEYLRRTDIREPGAFMRTVAVRKGIDRVRSNAARERVETPVGGLNELAAIEERISNGQPTTAEDAIFTTAFNDILYDMSDTLLPSFLLVVMRGCSPEEAAGHLRISRDTVRRNVEAARKDIARRLT